MGCVYEMRSNVPPAPAPLERYQKRARGPCVSWFVRDFLHKVQECASTGIYVYICEWWGRVIRPYDIFIYISIYIYISILNHTCRVSSCRWLFCRSSSTLSLSCSLPRRSGFMNRTGIVGSGDRMTNLNANNKEKFIESEFRVSIPPQLPAHNDMVTTERWR